MSKKRKNAKNKAAKQEPIAVAEPEKMETAVAEAETPAEQAETPAVTAENVEQKEPVAEAETPVEKDEKSAKKDEKSAKKDEKSAKKDEKSEKKDEKRAKAEKASKQSRNREKNTLNLCMKEKNSISVQLFCLLFVAIMLVVLLIEFFGIYQPYRAIEQAEADLASDRDKLTQIQDKIKDYDSVREDYLKYNYEHYDKTLVDRLDVLEMLGRTVFAVGKVQSLSISSNAISLTASGIDEATASSLYVTLLAEEIVETVNYRMFTAQESSEPRLTMAITLVNSQKGGN